MISINIGEIRLSWHAKFSFLVAVRVSKTRVLKLPNDACRQAAKLCDETGTDNHFSGMQTDNIFEGHSFSCQPLTICVTQSFLKWLA